jgi:hypothetical protein
MIFKQVWRAEVQAAPGAAGGLGHRDRRQPAPDQTEHPNETLMPASMRGHGGTGRTIIRTALIRCAIGCRSV